ncbi:olfactomedin-4 [Stegastes partitus]|uniref:Olfactomedin-4 n=1 Tax=Stegastes partitus TaxID=144197 RepID=A0A9Y4JTP9_9TELE|nr:PREDICTED: olfactomedin-4-like [Stegastes partitus]
MLPVLLLLLPALSPAVAWIPVNDWESGNVTASVGESDQCVCHVYLPDTTFPADRLQHVQETSKDLIVEVDIQINKMVSYEGQLEVYLNQLKNLTVRLSMLQNSTEDYIKLDFELLRAELRDFEALVSQLRDSLSSSSPIFDSLYTEIHNMTDIVNQLESYDKSNLVVIRAEFAELQRKLKECQEEQDSIQPDIGNCNHTGIMSISKPVVIQLNAHLSPSYRYGGWGKDSKPQPGHESMYFYLANTSATVHDFSLYSDYENLILRSPFTTYSLPSSAVATGNNYIVYNNKLFYQRKAPYMLGKWYLTNPSGVGSKIPGASTEFSYSYSDNQYLDFSADETGLWVIYASDNNGKMVLGKFKSDSSSSLERTWYTGILMEMAGNAFMACGVMYATRPVDPKTEEIFYAYDTKTREEKHLSIPFQKFQETYTNLHYNPTDQKLYMYNNGYYVTYNVRFNKE